MWLPEAHAPEGTLIPLRGAAIRFSVDSRVYRRAAAGLEVFSSRLARAVGAASLRARSLPSTRGALAPSGAAIMAPSPGATNSRGHLGLGSALVAVGDPTAAIPHLQKAAADSDPAVREEAVQALRQMGKER